MKKDNRSVIQTLTLIFQVRIYVDSPEVLTGMTMEVRDE